MMRCLRKYRSVGPPDESPFMAIGAGLVGQAIRSSPVTQVRTPGYYAKMTVFWTLERPLPLSCYEARSNPTQHRSSLLNSYASSTLLPPSKELET